MQNPATLKNASARLKENTKANPINHEPNKNGNENC